MKARLVSISVPLLIGIAIGLLLAPSLWKGVGRALAQQQAANQEILTVAKVAMSGKKVFLISEDVHASAAAHMLVSLGASYAPTKEKADYLIGIDKATRGNFAENLDFRDRTGHFLHRVSVTESPIAEHEAFMFAWSLAAQKKT